MENNSRVDSLDELKLAPLSKSQEENLRELERQFNNSNNTAYYFIAMERK